MLEDREYMRQPSYERQFSFTIALLVINAIVFVVECILCHYPPLFSSNNLFALSLDGLKHGYVWQLLTFQFMHASIFHILFNSLTIFFFGRQVEANLGPAKFLTIYFSGGIIGGLLQMLGAIFWPTHIGACVVGASAGGMALIAAFATLYPDEVVTWFIYIFPVSMRAKYFVWAIAVISVLCTLFPFPPFSLIFGTNVANIAHLGGMLTGYAFVLLFIQGHWHMPQWKLPARQSAPRELAVKRAGKNSSWNSKSIPPAEDLSAAEFLQKEVDPILDKISASGIQSLTPREREILEKARSRMNKR